MNAHERDGDLRWTRQQGPVLSNLRLAILRGLTAVAALLLSGAAPVLGAEPPKLTEEQQQQIAEANALSQKVGALYQAGKYAAAVPLAKRALEISEKAQGKDHPQTAESLNNLATLYQAQGDYAAAVPLYKRALETWERTLGKDHPETATSLNNLAMLYKAQGDYAAALPLLKRALEIIEKALGKDHPETATGVNNLALLYQAQGDYTAALPLVKRALGIWEKASGKDHPETAVGLNNLAMLYQAQGDNAAALPLSQRALRIRERVLGKDHPDTATSLNNLALLYQAQGDNAAALPLYQRSLEIRERALGKDHPNTAISLDSLALLYQDQGIFAAALPLFKRSLEIRERILGKEHPQTATSLNSLASLYYAQGDYVAALPLFKRALEISEKAQGKDHPQTGTGLNNLALLYKDQGDYAAALPFAMRALEISEKGLGKYHPHTAAGLNNLARLYKAQGDYAAALPLFKRALEISEKALGKDHSQTAAGLNNLALLYKDQGDYAAALPLAKQALEIWENALDKDHPQTATSLNNLASLYYAQGDYAPALPLVKRALEISRKSLEAAGAVQAERQQLAMAKSVRPYIDAYLSCLAASGKPIGPDYPELLAGKGAIFMRQRWARLARTTGDLETLRVLTELQSASSRFATLSLRVPQPQQREAWQRQIAEAGAEKERLEGELSRLSAVFRQEQAQRKRGIAEIQAVLAAKSALVDLVEYLHYIPPAKKGDKWTNQLRLIAFVVRHDGPVKAIELQAATPIAAAVEKWRESLGSPRADGADSGRKLRELVWEKIEPELGDAKTVLISPDGVLAKIPWAALPGKRPGSYLLEERAIVVVPVPQALPELLAATPGEDASSLLCVGDVDYGAAPGKTDLQLASNRAAATSTVGRPEFSRLASTGPEAERIKALFEQRYAGAAAKYLYGTGATKEAFCTEAAQHRWLHLATHGFFADPKLRSVFQSDEQQQARQFMSFDQQRRAVGWDPGLLSGLALAGASRTPGDGEEDGILTASEVASMNLSRVELAVLSACETGLGETAGGEGILGMQRAFQVAGAKNVVASLWKVDDAATQALMTEFYTNLWQKKLPPIEALRKAQLKMIADYSPTKREFLRAGGFEDRPFNDNAIPKLKPGETRLPPFYWAAFVLSGAGK